MDAEEIADAWWDQLPGHRRVQIHDWIEGKPAHPPALPGQIDLMDQIEEREER